ncbi:bifunctional riboflavin kinase/FAD synthetase [Maledivibacter halophilus]|uniref:Riboflavin biosynthesis protein n=1 Tax=Maledivibacter halophilus TaxID=36842 RepID=A0A1T5LFA1_9FIRM|nr:bifunctional riboflavin kinase/FAD synthetase [Maledivibacter halophilus]SKC74068.1 riboflavin kinase / FMN adenylyltransferase [Maledivibacter halophilus]
MEVIHSLGEIGSLTEMTGVSLGTFDGLHKGHITLIKTLKEDCKLQNLKSVIYTFSNHPRELINSKNSPRLIINNKQKIDLFYKMGIDFLVMVKFDNFQKNIRAEDFIEEILLKKLNMKAAIVGWDCHFGRKAEGNIELLKEFSQKYDFDLTVVPPLKIDNEIISSTSIRSQLSKGLIDKVNLFLGRNYSITGRVIKGKQFGGTQGFPTANISVDLSLCLPKSGVYITRTVIDRIIYKSITNVGFNPTFNQRNYNIETYIFDFSKNIYDKEVTVEFLHKIRDDIKFDNVENLYKQVKTDIDYAKNYFNI